MPIASTRAVPVVRSSGTVRYNATACLQAFCLPISAPACVVLHIAGTAQHHVRAPLHSEVNATLAVTFPAIQGVILQVAAGAVSATGQASVTAAAAATGTRRSKTTKRSMSTSHLMFVFRAAVHSWLTARPNPSLERTSTGKPLGPRASAVHHPSRGPSAFPAGSAQLKR